ncbi:unnamed protein product [Closterium sp. NIES-64]|nr:unnamed protein product [Closterium sp. NIES-65]CAI6005640.1 unnamed protein product [Closterium sp. NIES-64]CAI6007326.1 unnamed protein product [Closterium sp. NIES-65]
MGNQASSACRKAVPESPVSGSATECVQQPQQAASAAQGLNHSEPSSGPRLFLGCSFHSSESPVWQEFPDPSGARYNPPAATLPLPFELYGQPFYRGFQWEKKV